MESTTQPADAFVEFLNAKGPRFGDWMQLYSGNQFWPLDPRESEIEIEDIAHALSMQCRYAGHCLRFYSVAEHSVLVSIWVRMHYGVEDAMWALLHDASEAYLVDVPRPVKPFLGGYKEAEANLHAVIARRFQLPHVIPASVHEADNRILCDERAQNMSLCVHPWGIPDDPLNIKLEFWTPEQAEAAFLDTYWSLIEARRG